MYVSDPYPPNNLLGQLLKDAVALMNGTNYVAVGGGIGLPDATTEGAARMAIANQFDRPNLDITFTPVSKSAMLQDIQSCLEDRGIAGAEVIFETEADEAILRENQKHFLVALIDHLAGCNIYACQMPDGFPAYDVWWQFNYVALHRSGHSFYLYGAASD